jgi:hypothetical protein
MTMALVVGAASVASADARDVLHFSGTVGPVAHDYPAGTICDFAYHEEFINEDVITVFFDDDGNPVRVEEQAELWVLHRNLDTGLTLTETVHYALYYDLVAGEVRLTGNWWHLRDAENRIVFIGSGMFVRVLFTGELVRATPKVAPDFAETMCPPARRGPGVTKAVMEFDVAGRVHPGCQGLAP